MNSQVNRLPSAEALALAAEKPCRLIPPAVVRELSEVLGTPAVALIGGVRNTRSVYQWLSGERQPERLDSLRFALQIVYILRVCGESDATAAAWFRGVNARLGDTSPTSLLATQETTSIFTPMMSAVRAFVGLREGNNGFESTQ